MKLRVAYNSFRAWLTADKIQHRGDPELLTVDIDRGHSKLIIAPLETPPPKRLVDIYIEYYSLLGTDSVATGTYNIVLRALGLPVKNRLFRTSKLPKNSLKTDEFLLTIRSNEFIKTPNPPAMKWEEYRTVLLQEALSFYYKHVTFFLFWGYKLQDLKTFVNTCAVIFFARYEQDNISDGDNKKLMRAYLRQRLQHLYRTLSIKGKSVFSTDNSHERFQKSVENDTKFEDPFEKLSKSEEMDCNRVLHQISGNLGQIWINPKKLRAVELYLRLHKSCKKCATSNISKVLRSRLAAHKEMQSEPLPEASLLDL